MNKAFLILGVAGVLTFSLPTMTTKAIEVDTTTTYSDEVQPRATGLIASYGLTVSASGGKLVMGGVTTCTGTMKSVGLKDIKVQYSSDGSTWKTEKTLSDLLKSSSSQYSIGNYSISVNGGYYYRITCNHYAKESGLLGSSQSVYNVSSSVWIS